MSQKKPSQEREPMFGHFECETCSNAWKSARTLIVVLQHCVADCHRHVYPRKLESKEPKIFWREKQQQENRLKKRKFELERNFLENSEFVISFLAFEFESFSKKTKRCDLMLFWRSKIFPAIIKFYSGNCFILLLLFS